MRTKLASAHGLLRAVESLARCQGRFPSHVPNESLELRVEELLRRARPLPPYDEMVINDLTPDEAEAFLRRCPELTEPRSPVVVDTDVYSARLTPGSSLAQRYDALLGGRPAFLSFQIVAELAMGLSSAAGALLD